MANENHPHPYVALAEDLARTFHWNFPHQVYCDGLELLSEVLAARILWRVTREVHFAVASYACGEPFNYPHFLLLVTCQDGYH